MVMDTKKIKNEVSAIVRPCGGVIEFIEITRTLGDISDSLTDDIRATCSLAVFYSELALEKRLDGADTSVSMTEFNMECTVKMAPEHCHQCTGECPDKNKYNQALIEHQIPFYLEMEEHMHRKTCLGDANFNNGFIPNVKLSN